MCGTYLHNCWEGISIPWSPWEKSNLKCWCVLVGYGRYQQLGCRASKSWMMNKNVAWATRQTLQSDVVNIFKTKKGVKKIWPKTKALAMNRITAKARAKGRHDWKVIAQTPLLLMQKALHYWSLTEHHDGFQGVHTWNTLAHPSVKMEGM